MEPLTVLLWLGVVIAALFVLGIIVFLVVVIAGVVLGLRGMRKDEDEEIFTGGGRS